MAKEFKTRGELQKLVLDEARNSGKCSDVPDIVITGPFPSRELTWDIRKQPGSMVVSVEYITGTVVWITINRLVTLLLAASPRQPQLGLSAIALKLKQPTHPHMEENQ